ncbi:hypothetical protein BM525_20780 (plasmid) [Alteromonas mediterranea]|uniref:5'-3' exonuclease domain-containing protein n=1 Tax=Alteromonas mediterranea TaxID=314275 RepID=A0AAC9JGS3_9ALTE|nr:5'-3' exonuclease H3TH domain-containing protein [Alteromonas mediterranea]APD92300.1 hypothetical protein BM524_20555 [Alteromonas mediterranea]APE00161.1 hypothetical protein BM525_20780 [Alteromonas mediterranea]
MTPFLYAFDVNSIFGRAFPHTDKRVNNGNINQRDFLGGNPVYALRETLRIIRSEIDAVTHLGLPNTHIVMVCDHPGDNFRHAIFPKYKGNRPPKSAARRAQEAMLTDMLRAAGYPVLCIEGVEADDVLATLSTKLSAMGIGCAIFTGDKDLMSLCNDHTVIYNGKLKKIIRDTDVIEKFGVSRDLVLDVLALAGDTADNIPGVKNMSEASAAQLLQSFSFDDIVNTPEKILDTNLKLRKAICKSLKEDPQAAIVSKKLVTLKRDVQLSMNFKEMKFTGPNKEAFLPNFFDLEAA